jgi:hypothetical protein
MPQDDDFGFQPCLRLERRDHDWIDRIRNAIIALQPTGSFLSCPRGWSIRYGQVVDRLLREVRDCLRNLILTGMPVLRPRPADELGSEATRVIRRLLLVIT